MSSVENLVRDDCFRASLYTDAAVFEQEIERIFRKGWVWVAHESEIPLPGDFKTNSVYSAAILSGTKNADAAKALITFLRGAEAVKVLKAKGMEPTS